MTKFKISIHCGQVNTFAIEEHDNKSVCQEAWRKKTLDSLYEDQLLIIGDVLINPKQITFIVVEELVEQGAEPAAGTTIEVG